MSQHFFILISFLNVTHLFTRNYVSSGSVLRDTIHGRDVWGCLRFQETDPNVLVYVDRCCLHYLDTRVKNKF